MAAISSLVVEMSANVARLKHDFDKARAETRRFQSDVSRTMGMVTKAAGMLGIGLGATAIVSGLKNMISTTIQQAQEMDNLAQSVGTTAERLSRLEAAGRGVSVTGQDLARGMSKLANDMHEAMQGGEKQQQMFQRLGIAYVDANGKARDTSQVMLDLAERFQRMPNSVEKTALATELFGEKLAIKLIPFLNQGREGIDALGDAAARAGGVIDEKLVGAANRWEKRFQSLGNTIRRYGRDLVVFLDDIVPRFGDIKIPEIPVQMPKVPDPFGWFTERDVFADLEKLNKLQEEQGKRDIEIMKQQSFWRRENWKLVDKERLERQKQENELIERAQAERRAFMEQMTMEKKAWENAFGTIEDAVKRFGMNFTRTFTEMVMTGKMSWRALANSFVADFLNIIVHRMLTVPLFNMLFGGVGSMFGGGMLGGIFSIGGSSSMVAANQTLYSSWGLPAFADGGNPPIGRASIVGERGPELFVPRTAGTILPNGSGIGGTYYIDARGADRTGLANLENAIRQLNGSIERRALNAVAREEKKGGAFARRK